MQPANRPDGRDLVTRLAAVWPTGLVPEPAPTGLREGYLTTSLEGSELLAAVELGRGAGGAKAVAVATAGADGSLLTVPLVERAGAWRRAAAGDGVATALVRRLARPDADPAGGFELRPVHPAAAGRPAAAPADPGELAITVDQTNESVVVDGASIVKWVREPRRIGHPAARLLAHLAEVGFTGIPEPVGFLLWHDPDGHEILLAAVDTYLPDARDGWTWCVEDLLDHLEHHRSGCPDPCPADSAATLGRLTAGLHVALATPSSVIGSPVVRMGPDAAAASRSAAAAVLDRALDVTGGADGRFLRSVAPRLRESLAGLDRLEGAVGQPVHGDLHVGQVLRWRDGLAVIDFDGNPTVPAADLGRPEPAARDVAHLLRSLDHVGRVADRRTDGAWSAEVTRWVETGRRAFLDAYLAGLSAAGSAYLLDPGLLAPFEVEQECRELVYAAEFLPRWTYAPIAALRAMFPQSDDRPSGGPSEA